MKPKPLRTVLIGAGRVALGYGLDPHYARWYKYSTHAKVLAAHPDFDWVATVDRSTPWPGPDIQPLDVAVIATPSSVRLELLNQLPSSIKAVLVEKPLGLSLAECKKFLSTCRQRGILVQANLWRRADELHRRLAAGDLKKYIGKLQGINIIYDGNLQNTGSHLVDVIEMLAAPIQSVQMNPDHSGTLQLKSGVPVTLLALDPKYYRELTIDFWGTRGRLKISQEDLQIETWLVKRHRALRDVKEVAADKAGKKLKPTVGEAYYHMYTNLAQALRGQVKLVAPGELALRAAKIIDVMQTHGRYTNIR